MEPAILKLTIRDPSLIKTLRAVAAGKGVTIDQFVEQSLKLAFRAALEAGKEAARDRT